MNEAASTLGARARNPEISTGSSQVRPANRLDQLLNQMEETRQYTIDVTSQARHAADSLIGPEPEAEDKYPETASGGAFVDRLAEAVARQHKATSDLARHVRRLSDADIV